MRILLGNEVQADLCQLSFMQAAGEVDSGGDFMSDKTIWLLTAIVMVGFLNMITFPISNPLQNILVSFIVIMLAILAMRYYPMEDDNDGKGWADNESDKHSLFGLCARKSANLPESKGGL